MTRIAVINKEKCINGNGCNFICGKVCPVNRTGKECITLGPDNKPIIDEDLCIGCGICSKRCPAGCISIINLPAELEKPIHRYGKNGFCLYNLPIPIFGKVVGVLGRNGIGKSTALKVLAGQIMPNFGKEEKSSYEELIEFFKGSEAQLFFEKVNEGKIKISFKPQQVDLIAKTQKGKVRNLLKKVDEKNKLEEISKGLEIDKILDNDIKNVSGGELQRVAIAACVLKDANLYIFDEPSSYLDIKQRIKVSKFIRSLADENTAIIVVEHDLIILDYMTDLIHIMYGKEGCYGVVSGVNATKAGINVYLEGYLRDKKISFPSKPPLSEKIGEDVVSWKDIKKKLDSFVLKSDKGTISKKDVIGVLGENGIGKTTFIKILAGVLKADKGELDQKIKVSYKSQYISVESDILVREVLKDAMKYSNELINPLQLDKLLDKQLNQLSGGEIQRVAIAVCLGRKADLYLLDEPSAYLDVEQRLKVSKIIKDLMEDWGKTALVVDHDLLFIDHLSDKLMVFEGEPARKGNALGPFAMEDGMNLFLKDLMLSMRRDKESNRPRINKPGSQMDRKQKGEGKLYYS